MTLGDGIFWSSALIVGVVGVWAITRAKKWRLVAKVLALVVIALALVFGAFVGKEQYDSRAQPLDGLWGIKFGATPVDVQIAKGAPDGKHDPITDGKDLRLTWGYGLDSTSQEYLHLVIFSNNKASIICSGSGEYPLIVAFPFGFTGTTTEDEIVKKFGPRSYTSIRPDGLAKAISYPKYNVAFEIEKGVLKETCAITGGKLDYSEEYKPAHTSGAASDGRG